MVWERNEGFFIENFNRVLQEKILLLLLPADQNSKHNHKQMLSNHIHMLLPTFLVNICCIKLLSTSWVSSANDYHNRHILLRGMEEFII